MGFFGAVHGWAGKGGGVEPKSRKLSHVSYNDESRHSYTLPKEDPKNI